jgi:hypothetical protein
MPDINLTTVQIEAIVVIVALCVSYLMLKNPLVVRWLRVQAQKGLDYLISIEAEVPADLKDEFDVAKKDLIDFLKVTEDMKITSKEAWTMIGDAMVTVKKIKGLIALKSA